MRKTSILMFTLLLALAIGMPLTAQPADGEWTGWSNNPAHRARAKFDDAVISFSLTAGLLKAGRELQHAVDGDTVHFARGGASLSLRNALYDPPQKKDAGASDGRLVAPMNGRVVAVNASVGETIGAGKAADVLVVDGDPARDLRLLRDKSRIVLILQDGRIVKDRMMEVAHGV